jgi:hypothetical protein
MVTPTMFPVDKKASLTKKKSLTKMYLFLSSKLVISQSLVMVFFWGGRLLQVGPYLPNAAIWWCLRTGGGGVVTRLIWGR